MARPVSRVILGIDVSKEWLDVCRYGSPAVERIPNQRRAVQALLKRYPVAALAVEATNTYHELVVELALAEGLSVYLISGYQLKHYAKSLGQRMQNDALDARLLARLLEREIDQLRPYQRRCNQQLQVRRLLGRRALLVKQQQQLRQSLADLGLGPSLKSLIKRLGAVIALIEKRLKSLARELGWRAELDRLQSIPGVGLLTALALLEAYHSGQFPHRDAFIAFLGLDVRTIDKDSGKHKGRRKLTKQGNAEIRRLLYNAVSSAAQQGRYLHAAHEAYRARGLAPTQSKVVLMRKIARIAFALLNSGQDFDAQRHPCPKAA